MAGNTASGPTGADGFRLDRKALARLKQELDALIAETAAVYAAFGEHAGLPAVPVAGVAEVLGRANPGGAGPGPEIAEAYLAFFTAWGQYLDELTGVLTEVRGAVELTGAAWAGADEAAAAAFGRMARDGFDYSGLTALAAPATATGVGVGPGCTAPGAGADGRAGPPNAPQEGVAERWRRLHPIDSVDGPTPPPATPEAPPGGSAARGLPDAGPARRGGVW